MYAPAGAGVAVLKTVLNYFVLAVGRRRAGISRVKNRVLPPSWASASV